MITNLNLLLHPVLIILLLLSAGCSSDLGSNWQFKDDVTSLLLLEADVPSGWQVENVIQQPIPNTENLTVIYDAPLDVFGTNSLLGHSIIVFDDPTSAVNLLEAEYKIGLDLTEGIASSRGIQESDFTPPQKHTYRSPLADEFKVIYAPEIAVPTGVLVGYSYEVWARYGNVVSHFITIIEDKDQTQIEAGEANILPWPEVERLLKIIDERFQAAGMTAQ